MTTVSTASTLLQAMKFDDVVVAFLGEKESNSRRKMSWTPGFGAIGGAASTSMIAAYFASPEIAEQVNTLGDILGVTDASVDQAERLGLIGKEFKEGAQDPEKPRVSEAKPIEVKAPKAESSVPEPSYVSRGDQIPLPSTSSYPIGNLAVPTNEIVTALRSASRSEGASYDELYAVAGSESSFRAGAKASGSSATGLFQFTAPTWEYLTKKLYPELGYTMADRTDAQKSAVIAARYLKSIKESLRQKIGKAPTIGQTYLGYFMGPTGAARFIDAHDKNPNALGHEVFPSAAKANPHLFFNKGNKNEPLTLAQTLDRLEGKVNAYYAQASTGTLKAETAPPPVDVPSSAAVPVTANFKANAVPQPIAVTPPDFTSMPGGAKGEQREVAPIKVSGGSASGSGSTKIPLTGKQRPNEVTYTTDRQGRVIAIRG